MGYRLGIFRNNTPFLHIDSVSVVAFGFVAILFICVFYIQIFLCDNTHIEKIGTNPSINLTHAPFFWTIDQLMRGLWLDVS